MLLGLGATTVPAGAPAGSTATLPIPANCQMPTPSPNLTAAQLAAQSLCLGMGCPPGLVSVTPDLGGGQLGPAFCTPCVNPGTGLKEDCGTPGAMAATGYIPKFTETVGTTGTPACTATYIAGICNYYLYAGAAAAAIGLYLMMRGKR